MDESAGKHVFVTAGTAGIGLAIVTAFLTAGAKVSFFGRDEKRLASAVEKCKALLAEKAFPESNMLYGTADLSSEEVVEAFYQKATSTFGPVQILINNHGGPAPGKLNAVSPQDFISAFNIVLKSNFHLSQLVVPAMQQARWGRIINILSLSAKESLPNMTLSNTFRPAVIGLAKSMAIELAGDGITVNSVLPASALTDRTMFFVNQRTTKENKTPQQVISEIEATLPIGRMAQASEFADVTLFLCGEKAGYITGNVISLDGGLSKTIF